MAELLCPLAYQAHLFPERAALITPEKTWTYLECDAAVHHLGMALKKEGIAAKERVAFLAHPKASSILLYFALFRLKAIACPLSLREPPEKIPDLLRALGASHYLDAQALRMKTLSTGPTQAYLDEEQVATFLFTSGSSGTPKIACHSLKNHLRNAQGVLDFFGLTPASRWLLSLPIFHVGGLAILFRIFLSGGAVVLPNEPLAEALLKYRITHLSLVPTQLYRLLADSSVLNRALDQGLHSILIGGGPLFGQVPKDLPLIVSYGMTEMSSLITASKESSAEHAGKPLPFRSCTLSAQNEILVRGETLFLGYWESNNKEILSFCREEWFATSDIGALDAKGNLSIMGRKDRLFISGGENIQPEEIERALCTIPGIFKAYVLPVSDPDFGQRPIAFIEAKGIAPDLQGIREALRPLLPSFKHPIRIFF